MSKECLSQIREEIDKLDIQIYSLLNDRLKLCALMSEKKLKNNVCDPQREAIVLNNVSKNSEKRFEKNIQSIYKEIITQCKKVQ